MFSGELKHVETNLPMGPFSSPLAGLKWVEQVDRTMRHERVRRYAENRQRESLL